MKNSKTKLLGTLLLMSSLASCDLLHRVEMKAKVVNDYEIKALYLAKENRELKAELNTLKYEIQTLKSQNSYLALQMEKKGPSRGIASVGPVDPSNDLVKFSVYRWKPEELLKTARVEFKKKDYERAFQYYQTYLKAYPDHKDKNDSVLFEAALAAYESGNRYQSVLEILSSLTSEFPTSEHYRGAKLWMALSNLKMGKEKDFFNTVEEFRKKYRNTDEWQVLKGHYEGFMQKYKK